MRAVHGSRSTRHLLPSAAATTGPARSPSSATPSPTSGHAVGSSATWSTPTSRSAASTPCWATSGGCSTALITMLIYGLLVMTVIFQRSTPDFPLFLLSAMVPFKWFTATIGSSTGAVIGKEALIEQPSSRRSSCRVTSSLSQASGFLFGMLVAVRRAARGLQEPPDGPGRVGCRSSRSCSSSSCWASPSWSRPSRSSTVTWASSSDTSCACSSGSRPSCGRSTPWRAAARPSRNHGRCRQGPGPAHRHALRHPPLQPDRPAAGVLPQCIYGNLGAITLDDGRRELIWKPATHPTSRCWRSSSSRRGLRRHRHHHLQAGLEPAFAKSL